MIYMYIIYMYKIYMYIIYMYIIYIYITYMYITYMYIIYMYIIYSVHVMCLLKVTTSHGKKSQTIIFLFTKVTSKVSQHLLL